LSSNISIIRKNSLLGLIGSGLFLFVGLSFVNLLLTGFLLQLVKLVSGFELSWGITYLVLLGIILAWYLIRSIRGGIIQELKVEENTLSVKKLTGQTMVLHKNEIRKVDWKKNKFVFHRMGSPFVFTTPNWAVTNILFYWMPENLLPLEVRHSIREAKGLAEKPAPTFEKSLQVGSKGNIISGLIELNNEGIEHKTLLGRKFFRWGEIEVVEVKSKGRELKIWVNGRYTRINLNGLAPKEQELLRESFLTQIYTRGIPVCYSETRF
jgi:hypothetical protein